MKRLLHSRVCRRTLQLAASSCCRPLISCHGYLNIRANRNTYKSRVPPLEVSASFNWCQVVYQFFTNTFKTVRSEQYSSERSIMFLRAPTLISQPRTNQCSSPQLLPKSQSESRRSPNCHVRAVLSASLCPCAPRLQPHRRLPARFSK